MNESEDPVQAKKDFIARSLLLHTLSKAKLKQCTRLAVDS